MVLDKGHHTRRVRVEVVVYKRAVKAVQSFLKTVGLFILRLTELVVEREVHHRFQVRVSLSEFRVFLPSSGISRLCDPCLTYGVEVGIFFVNLFHPLGHSICVGIRISVHADAVDANGLNPPHAVLDEVAQEVWIMLIQIWHRGYEPAFGCLLEVNLRSVRVDNRCQFVTSLQILTLWLLVQPIGSIQPVFRWHVLGPRVLKSAMIENHVHNNLQSFRVGFVAKMLVVLVRTETWVYLIIVGSGITVVCGKAVLAVGRVVLHNRGEPKGGDTKFIKVVEVLTDAVQVATMAERRFGTILYIIAHTLDLLWMISTLCKAIGHELIEDVGVGESHTFVATHLTLFQ